MYTKDRCGANKPQRLLAEPNHEGAARPPLYMRPGGGGGGKAASMGLGRGGATGTPFVWGRRGLGLAKISRTS